MTRDLQNSKAVDSKAVKNLRKETCGHKERLTRNYEFPEESIFENDKLTKKICALEPLCNLAMRNNSDEFDSVNSILYSCREGDNRKICSASHIISSIECQNDSVCSIEYSEGRPSSTSEDGILIFNCNSENLSDKINSRSLEDYCAVTHMNFTFNVGQPQKNCTYKTIMDFKTGFFFKTLNYFDKEIEKIEIPQYVEITKGEGVNVYDATKGDYILPLFRNQDIEVVDIRTICISGGEKIVRVSLCSDDDKITFTNIKDETTPDYVYYNGGGCNGMFTGNVNGQNNNCGIYRIEQSRTDSDLPYSSLTYKVGMTNCNAQPSELLGIANL